MKHLITFILILLIIAIIVLMFTPGDTNIYASFSFKELIGVILFLGGLCIAIEI